MDIVGVIIKMVYMLIHAVLVAMGQSKLGPTGPTGATEQRERQE